METTYTEYLEIPAPLHIVNHALHHPALWQALFADAEHLGSMWRYGNELYTLCFSGNEAWHYPNNQHPNNQHPSLIPPFPNSQQDGVPAPPDNATPPEPLTLHWKIVPAAVVGTHGAIDMTLYDATVATHIILRVTISHQGSTFPWQSFRLRKKIADLVNSSRQAFLHLLERSVEKILAENRQDGPGEQGTTTVDTPTTATAQAVATMQRATSEGVGYPPASPFTASSATETIPAPMLADPYLLAEHLRPLYPRTVATFEAMGAQDHLQRIWRLEQGWERSMRGEYNPAMHEICALQREPATPQHSTFASNGLATNQSEQPLNLVALMQDQEQTGYASNVGHIPGAYDLIYAGGGLGLLHATVMAKCYGKRVMLFDRGDVGCAHREWNISREELQALVGLGLATWEELETVIMRKYRTGLVQFYTGPHTPVPHSDLWMPNVLSLAINAQGLLQLMRRKFEEAGGVVLDRRSFHKVRVHDGTPVHVEVDVENLHAPPDSAARFETYRAQLLLDCMGSTSPLALLRHARMPFAGVCPTVGTTVHGFAQGNGPREYDPEVGDILISVADTQHDRQLIWEGFPGYGDEVAVYVFYYVALNDYRHRQKTSTAATTPGTSSATAHSPHSSNNAQKTQSNGQHQTTYSLLELFEHYFTLLPTYKKPGPDFRHVKPLYGYIPGRHSLRANEAPMLRGVLPIGDSAAQQSPLTYCGFGSHVRNLHRTTSLLNYAMEHTLLEPQHLQNVNAFQTNVSLNWVFSRFMQPWGQPDNVNELQNVFLGTLNELGIERAQRFFKDQTRWIDYNNILGTVLRRYPVIMLQAWKVLEKGGIIQWGKDYLRFTQETIVATAARKAGPKVEQALYRLADTVSPANSLRVRARYAEWRVMKWL